MNSHFHLFSDRIQRIEFNIASKHEAFDILFVATYTTY